MRIFACLLALILSALAGAAHSQPVPAANDSSATYLDGQFNLPESIDSKTRYVVVIQGAGDKDRVIELPEGAFAFRLTAAARPVGTWHWSCFTRPLTPRTLTTYSQTEPKAEISQRKLRGPADKRLMTVEWAHDSRAIKYQVKTEEFTVLPDGTQIPGKKGTVEISKEELNDLFEGSGQRERVMQTLPVTAGQHLKWSIEGLDARDDVVAKSLIYQSDIEPPWSATFAKAGFKLQRAETLVAKELRPTDALLSFSKTSSAPKPGETATPPSQAFASEFAILWAGDDRVGSRATWMPTASFEARLNSNGSAKASDVMRGRFGLAGILPAQQSSVVSNLKWERDRKTKLETGLVEVMATPLFDPFAVFHPRVPMDVFGNKVDRAPIEFAFLPSLGVDVGKVLSSNLAGVSRDSVVRIVGLARIDFEFPFVAEILRLPRVSGTATETIRYLTREDSDRRRDFLSSSLDFWLSPNLALSLTYKVGRDAPAYIWGRNFSLGVSGRF